jgi:hypothetical protein
MCPRKWPISHHFPGRVLLDPTLDRLCRTRFPLTWVGNRSRSWRGVSWRTAWHTGHSTRAIPLTRNWLGMISTISANEHVRFFSTRVGSPTESRVAARSIRDGGRGRLPWSVALLSGPSICVSALTGAGATMPSNCWRSWILCVFARSTLNSPVHASISKRTRWSGCSAYRVKASMVNVVAPS